MRVFAPFVGASRYLFICGFTLSVVLYSDHSVARAVISAGEKDLQRLQAELASARQERDNLGASLNSLKNDVAQVESDEAKFKDARGRYGVECQHVTLSDVAYAVKLREECNSRYVDLKNESARLDQAKDRNSARTLDLTSKIKSSESLIESIEEQITSRRSQSTVAVQPKSTSLQRTGRKSNRAYDQAVKAAELAQHPGEMGGPNAKPNKPWDSPVSITPSGKGVFVGGWAPLPAAQETSEMKVEHKLVRDAQKREADLRSRLDAAEKAPKRDPIKESQLKNERNRAHAVTIGEQTKYRALVDKSFRPNAP